MFAIVEFVAETSRIIGEVTVAGGVDVAGAGVAATVATAGIPGAVTYGVPLGTARGGGSTVFADIIVVAMWCASGGDWCMILGSDGVLAI